MSEGWELYEGDKAKARRKAPEQPAPDGTELTVSPKKPKAAPPTPGGAEELPGSPRPKPKAVEGEEDFRKQTPKGLEEDAEVWDGKKWTTPSGRTEDLAPGVAEAPAIQAAKEAAGPVVEEDEDTEIIVNPKRHLPPEPQTRARTAPTNAKLGKDGQDFQEYTKPVGPPPSAPPSQASQSRPATGFADMVAKVTGTPAPSAPAEFRPYGASSVPDAPPSAPASPPPPSHPPSQVHASGLPQGALNVLLVGSGAREHAMALAIRRSQRAHLFVAMRHRNPGLAKSATGFKLLDEKDAAGIVAWARTQRIHLAVVGPEAALESGTTDALRAAGIAVASPSRAAARIETSKTFMREVLARHNLPGNLAFHAFNRLEPALAFLDQHGPAWAVKPVGLTGGKGVQVYGEHFHDVAGAKEYVRSIFTQNAGGGAVQFEEVATGEEFSLMAFTDGTAFLPMPAVQDHKRLREGDEGPNTGGMGSYSQSDGLLPFLSAQDYMEAARILHGIVAALAADGTPYVGTIYGQFMLTASGPKVIEVNARFGDPEAMNVLHLLESDYLSILEGMATGTLAGREARFRGASTVVKYMVPRGYGEGQPASGRPVEIDEFNIRRVGGAVYMGAIEQKPYGGLETMTSRTLAVLGEGQTIADANAVCEASLRHVHGKDLYVRHDIGTPELLARRMQRLQGIRG